MFDLSGKTVLVTGASGGIGRDIAKTLHDAGANVGLAGTREAVLQELADEMGEGAMAPSPWPKRLRKPSAVSIS
jgi:3-oxoacyl-[acyl-carrier protein] reductase